MREDAAIYAETIFLQRMTRKNFLTQLRQVDNGDNSARMHEVVNQTITQIRENSKFSSTQRTELEKFYKEIRKDLGLNEITPEVPVVAGETGEEDLKVMDTRNLNDLIDHYLKNKPA
jgi:acetoacetate decarboxylase